MPGHFGAERSLARDFLHGLLHDLDALANFGDAHLVARVAIAGSLRLHVEIEFVVAGIRESFAHVVCDAAAAQHWAGTAHGDGVGGADDAHALGAAQPNFIFA